MNEIFKDPWKEIWGGLGYFFKFVAYVSIVMLGLMVGGFLLLYSCVRDVLTTSN